MVIIIRDVSVIDLGNVPEATQSIPRVPNVQGMIITLLNQHNMEANEIVKETRPNTKFQFRIPVQLAYVISFINKNSYTKNKSEIHDKSIN